VTQPSEWQKRFRSFSERQLELLGRKRDAVTGA